MSVQQPHGIKYHLPDGSGVVLERCCVTCDAMNGGVVCPVCRGLYCGTPCYGQHAAACRAAHPEETLRWQSSDAYRHLVLGPQGPKITVPRPASS